MKTLDKQILTALKSGMPTSQKELAITLGVKPDAIAKSLTRLAKDDLIVLQRCGQPTIPRLKVLVLLDDLFAAQRTLKAALA